MVNIEMLVHYCDNYLCVDGVEDYCPNGLQIQGVDKIRVVATAVTASLEVIKLAVKAKADVLLVHHGFFWKNESPVIVKQKFKRIKMLINNEINLLAYHLPLDMHVTVGNNALFAKVLGINNPIRYQNGPNKGLFWSGEFEPPLTVAELTKLIEKKLNRKPLVVSSLEKSTINKVSWCTGAAQNMLINAVDDNCDAFISGEISESTYHLAKESAIAYFSAGHHATERYGVQALGELLANKYNLEHVFIDENNPV